MATITMERTAPPRGEEQALSAEGRHGPYFFSFGDLDLVCSECGFVLFRGLPGLAAGRRLVAECPGCGTYMAAADISRQ